MNLTRIREHGITVLCSWNMASYFVVIELSQSKLAVIQKLRVLVSYILCSSPFTEAVPPLRGWSIRGVPPSVNELVHSLSIPHLLEWTGSFAECTPPP